MARVKRAVAKWSSGAFQQVSLADALSQHRVEPPNSPGLRIDVNNEMNDMPSYAALTVLQWGGSINAGSTVADVYVLALGKLS